MELLKRCPRCGKPLEHSRQWPSLEFKVLECPDCQVFGVEGDDQFYTHKSLGEAGLKAKLIRRHDTMEGRERDYLRRYVEEKG